MARAAQVSSMKNIEAIVDKLPRAAVCQLKNLNRGRKFGAEPTFRKKQARFIIRKVIYEACCQHAG
jgi:hypothetical protein